MNIYTNKDTNTDTNAKSKFLKFKSFRKYGR